jgi:hypothetical protein
MEIAMFTKTKITLAAVLVLGAASAALADDMPYSAEKNAYLRNPNAPVPTYQTFGRTQPVRGQLIEGRNVGDWGTVYSEQKRSFDRSAIDFNS